MISRIEPIGGERAGGGWGGGGGGWEAEGGLKQPLRLKEQCCAFSLWQTTQTQRAVLCLQFVAQTDTIHKGGQDWREEQPGTPYSPINAPQDHEMHPSGFTASIKSRL